VTQKESFDGEPSRKFTYCSHNFEDWNRSNHFILLLCLCLGRNHRSPVAHPDIEFDA
jgi:hypothetical protein